MKKIVLTCLAFFTMASMNAQIDDDWGKEMRDAHNNARKEFEQFRSQAQQELDNFRKQANEEYARFMEEAWKSFKTMAAEKVPEKPKPPQPIVDPEPVNPKQPVPDPIRLPDPVVSPTLPVPDPNKPVVRPCPVEPIKPAPMPPVVTQTVKMYGSSFPFHYEKKQTLRLDDVSEKSVSKMWTALSEPTYDIIIAECLAQRDERNLCDWAYLKLTQAVAENYCGKGTNEAVVMQMYLLTQSGYQMRIGYADNRLSLLIGSKETIYGYKYYQLDGKKFYVLDKDLKSKGMNIFNHSFPKETPFSLDITQPDLAVVKTSPRTLVSKRYPNVKVVIETNKNLIDFYNEYPLSSRWENYSKASLSPTLKSTLYPVLRKSIEGKTKLEAANILINFVQTGFEYATDGEQFGYERPLFPDESFYYPYCDCEDRSILFSCLVRELLGLEVVLLDYPTHIATAICFPEDVCGDYLMLDGKKFVISDPTYIGAPVGKCAPKYKTLSPNIVRF